MGILNLSPDSFSDGGKYLQPEKAVQHAIQMWEDGASIIDLGAESTRPKSQSISENEEWQRLAEVLPLLRASLPDCCISIDTQKSYVASRAIAAGADMINDVSALEYDPQMVSVLCEHPGVELVLMHMQGRPETMQIDPQYTDVVAEVKHYLMQRMQYAELQGISRDRIYLDPGLGFGKTLPHNLALLANLDVYEPYKVLLGASRKSFINAITPASPSQRIGGSLASTMWAMLSNVEIIRVHDVFAHHQFMQVMTASVKWERRR